MELPRGSPQEREAKRRRRPDDCRRPRGPL